MASQIDVFDYLICGGGTAGCALAARLKQGNPGLSVALIERGPDEQRNELVLNPLAMAGLKDVGLDSTQQTVAQDFMDGGSQEIHAGNMLSGSSAVNAGLWMRGHSKDYDHWAELAGDQRWNYANMLPSFKRTETHHDPSGSKELHGFDGPMKTRGGRKLPLRQTVHDGLLEIELKDNADANGGDPFGISEYTENWSPVRQPAGLAYDLTGVDVVLNATIKRVTLKNPGSGAKPRATGVELTDGRKLHARKEVIVSCGAYRTPQLLMLSGIGSREQLDQLGIDTVAESRFVGTGLWDHLCVFSFWKLKPETAARGVAMGSPDFMAQPSNLEGLPCDWMTIDSVSEKELAAALHEDGEDGKTHHLVASRRAHHWLTVTYMPVLVPEGLDVAVNGEHITIMALNFQPTSRGTVTLRSKDPTDWPVIDPRYLSTHADRYVFRAAARKAFRLAETPSMQSILAEEKTPNGFPKLHSQSSDADIDARVRMAKTINHGAGTAAMGKVVDSDLRVKGVEGLRICDASVFPAPISATLQATVYAVAEHLAEIILQESR